MYRSHAVIVCRTRKTLWNCFFIGKAVGEKGVTVCDLRWRDPNISPKQRAVERWERRIILAAALLCRLAIGEKNKTGNGC